MEEIPKLHLDPLDKSEIELIEFKIKELLKEYDDIKLKNIFLDLHKIYILLNFGKGTFRKIDYYYDTLCRKCHAPINEKYESKYSRHIDYCTGIDMGNAFFHELSINDIQQCKNEVLQIYSNFPNNYDILRQYVLNLHAYIGFLRDISHIFKNFYPGICAKCHIIGKQGRVRICSSCKVRYCANCYTYKPKECDLCKK